MRQAASEHATPLGSGYDRCKDTTPLGTWECDIPFRFEGTGQIDFVPVLPGFTLHQVETRIIKASLRPAAGIGSLFGLIASLSVLGLVFLWARPAIPLKLILLGAIGATWLVVSSAIGGLLLLAIIVGLYLLLRLQLDAPRSPRRLAVTATCVVAILVLVKMYGSALGLLFANPGGLNIAVPLGFAFFVIRGLDLALRIGTREISELRPLEYFTYMLFPATLAAGPIYTVTQFRQAAIDRPSIVDWTAGLARIAIGVAKKTVADILLVGLEGPRLTSLYADPLGLHASDLWLLLATNALYVYLDFSGYSDIAIGVGRQIGWRVPENFNWPFLCASMRSFWQSWHITMSAWVTRWVHFFTAFPLRRSGRVAQLVLPVLTSLLIIGLWHEIQLSWVAWGLHHGFGILIGDMAGAASVVWVRPSVRSPARILGVVFVWAWVALSHCFTLISDPVVALQVYCRALLFGAW